MRDIRGSPGSPRSTPPHRLAFEWTPGLKSPTTRNREPRTLVEFRSSPRATGRGCTIVESGFDALPEPLRESALRSNTQGWDIQTENVRAYAEG
jgi:uncharacterized protein YndB with AHSA1/START domain